MKKSILNKKILIGASLALITFILFCIYALFTPLTHVNENIYIYVRPNDTQNKVFSLLKANVAWPQRMGVNLLAIISGYEDNMHTGRYAIHPNENAVSFFRALRGGRQEPISITIPEVRTMRDLANYLGNHLMFDSLEFLRIVSDSSRMKTFGVSTANVYCLFIPNTYEVYWNISINDFLKRMKRESEGFWNDERLKKAATIPLTPNEVYTLASIIDEETSNNKEKPDIAGMYINRLHKSMPLQADPTIKYAHGNFTLRRIYHSLLNINSPYNTYKNTGLPPGPIRIASVYAIDAVLNYTHHPYLYMCAKDDFSGTHSFARTYSEHLANAARYSKALDKRGIK